MANSPIPLRKRPLTVYITREEQEVILTTKNKPSFFKKIKYVLQLELLIVSEIWWQVLLVANFAAVIVALNQYVGTFFYMEWTTSLVPILGVVTGLLLVFRTNTAYDRYYEGRRQWALMTQSIRTLTRWIWILVKEEGSADVIRKKSAVDLLLAFAISVKHYLREEYAYNYEDLTPLIGHLPKMFPVPKVTEPPKGNGIINYAPPTNIPLQISYYIGIYINSIKMKEKFDTSVSGILFGALNSLVECLTGFERIKRTPIPPAYSVHLRHVIWLYVLALPFQLVSIMGWWTIAATALSSFTFFGILKIGSAIEDPFNDGNFDLPLDDLCDVLKTEINDILGTKLPTPEEMVNSDKYTIIESDGRRFTSSDLMEKSVAEIHDLLNAAAHDNKPHFKKHNEQGMRGIQILSRRDRAKNIPSESTT